MLEIIDLILHFKVRSADINTSLISINSEFITFLEKSRRNPSVEICLLIRSDDTLTCKSKNYFLYISYFC